MSSISNVALLTAVIAGSLLAPPPAGAVLISFDPVESTVLEGDEFDVGVRVSGLEDLGADDLVAAFDLDLLFDSSILTATGFTFGDALGPADLTIFAPAPGVADLFQLSFLSDADLAADQGDSILLGSLRLLAIGIGQSLLSFDADPFFGQNIVGREGVSLPVTVSSGRATVLSRPVAVAEPGSLALCLTLLLGIAFQRRLAAGRRPAAKPRS